MSHIHHRVNFHHLPPFPFPYPPLSIVVFTSTLPPPSRNVQACWGTGASMHSLSSSVGGVALISRIPRSSRNPGNADGKSEIARLLRSKMRKSPGKKKGQKKKKRRADRNELSITRWPRMVRMGVWCVSNKVWRGRVRGERRGVRRQGRPFLGRRIQAGDVRRVEEREGK